MEFASVATCVPSCTISSMSGWRALRNAKTEKAKTWLNFTDSRLAPLSFAQRIQHRDIQPLRADLLKIGQTQLAQNYAANAQQMETQLPK